jgi:rRNA-processing protein FCF1
MDTNFLMIPSQFKVDIFKELNRLLDVNYEIFVPDKVIKELKTLSVKGALKERKAARIALELSKDLKTVTITGSDPDEAILSQADRETVVCTNDRRLREAIRKKGGRAIYLKQRRFLELEGGDVGIS